MTKAELVEVIAAETGVSKKDTGVVVNLILENISRALESSDKVELRGFGSFKVKSRRSRTARNPRSGDSVMVPAKLVPYFKASNELKSRLNDGETD
ncbi:MAG: HU family DNA-binding protein [Candidatus Krumholzibacteriia bacterium]